MSAVKASAGHSQASEQPGRPARSVAAAALPVRDGEEAWTEAELDELEAVLELPDVDLADWLSGRRPIPEEVATPMLLRIAAETGRRD